MSYTKRTKLWTAIVFVLILSVFAIYKIATYNPGGNSLADPINASDWTRGNPEAKVTLIEYSDFQCPACAYFAEIIKQINSEFGNHIYFAYRHFPLNIHRNAEPAARAANAAGLQGKFWEMAERLFAYQEDWSETQDPEGKFLTYAAYLGLKIDQFKADYSSAKVKDAVAANLKNAENIGLNSTPTFFLNGIKIENNPRTHEDFRKIVRDAIDASGGNKTGA